MCAATSQMVAKVAELMELRKMIEDLNAEAELIADEIKAYMGEEETMTAGCNARLRRQLHGFRLHRRLSRCINLPHVSRYLHQNDAVPSMNITTSASEWCMLASLWCTTGGHR